MLDFRVDTFLAVCRCMNFTRAAAALHIAARGPAHSGAGGAVRRPLFSFEGKKLTLTDAGRLFLRTATTMRHDAQHLRDALGSLSGGGRRLVFGATLTIGEYVMPARSRAPAGRGAERPSPHGRRQHRRACCADLIGATLILRLWRALKKANTTACPI